MTRRSIALNLIHSAALLRDEDRDQFLDHIKATERTLTTLSTIGSEEEAAAAETLLAGVRAGWREIVETNAVQLARDTTTGRRTGAHVGSFWPFTPEETERIRAGGSQGAKQPREAP